MITQQHECELGCGRPAPETWLCRQCVDEIRKEVNEFTDDDRQALLDIAEGRARPAARHRIPSGTRSRRRDVVNVSVLSLVEGLEWRWADWLKTLATDERGVNRARIILADCDRIHELLDGPNESTVTPEYLAARMSQLPLLSRQQMSVWLAENLDLNVSPARIHKWKQRGELVPRVTNGKVHLYHPVDILHTLENKPKSPRHVL